MTFKKIAFTEKCGETTAYIAALGAAALLSCFAGEYPAAAVRAAAGFIGDISVMAMFTLYFSMTANAFARAYPEKRTKILCAADCAALVLNTAFAALCAISGGMIIHTAALITEIVFSRIYAVRDKKF